LQDGNTSQVNGTVGARQHSPDPRCIAIAITKLEEASTWAVKSLLVKQQEEGSMAELASIKPEDMERIAETPAIFCNKVMMLGSRYNVKLVFCEETGKKIVPRVAVALVGPTLEELRQILQSASKGKVRQ
jgi:hypothetical protein